jgi:hypothetical protein
MTNTPTSTIDDSLYGENLSSQQAQLCFACRERKT